MIGIQKVYFIICSGVGLSIAGMLGYFGQQMPLRVVLLGLILSAITLYIMFLWIDKRLKRRARGKKGQVA